MTTQTKVERKLVQCPNGDICGNPDCMHYQPHEPVYHGEKAHENCRDEKTICPLTGMTGTCDK